MATPADLLGAWIARRASPEAMEWFETKRAELTRDAAPKLLAGTFSMAVRRMGKAGLALKTADLAAAEAARPGWQPGDLTVDQAARILLLLDAGKANGSLVERLQGLVATADVCELIAIYKGLPLYPEPDRLVPLATNGLRTTMRAVFEAVAHQNPFPAEHLAQGAWNHMVLKCLFIDSILWPIAGLDRRWNEELAQILVDYAHERWAAGRPVTPELWRGVGRFACTQAVGDLARVLGDPNPLAQKAAALALADSRDPAAATALAHRSDLADAIGDGDLTWDDIRNPISAL